MATWDTGPFDNDTDADFANVLDDVEPEAREALIRGVPPPNDRRNRLSHGGGRGGGRRLDRGAMPGRRPRRHALRPGSTYAPVLFRPARTRRRSPRPASPATRRGRPQTGSTRRTGSSGEPYLWTVMQFPRVTVT
ncbi:DUF4259 domain-containing protein [Streptomyces sp. PBH53]|uniref:DUF4259 domain-containing protein n=1 Tax=Streptomyces sp. PBH53 TaxID=1577075 RepID=UPI003965BDA7